MPITIFKKYCFIIAALVILLLFTLGVLLTEWQEPLHPRPLFLTGINIEGVDWEETSGQIKVYVRNLDNKNITLTQIYVNGKMHDKIVTIPQVLSPNSTTEITLSEIFKIIPNQITIEIHTDNNGSVCHEHTFIDFEMLMVEWDENTGKIKIVVCNSGEYPEVNLAQIYINGTLDEKAVITKKNLPGDMVPSEYQKTYEISLSGVYATKPIELKLRIVADHGRSFEFASPFHTQMTISLIKWYESTGEIKFLVYSPFFSIIKGTQDVTFDKVCVNGTLDESAIITRVYSETYEVALSRRYATCPSQVTVEVITEYGAVAEAFEDNLKHTLPSHG